MTANFREYANFIWSVADLIRVDRLLADAPGLAANLNNYINGFSENMREVLEREVKPHVPDAWINRAILDHKDGRVGKVGYEINFNRYFYKYQPPRPLEEIEADIKTIEKDILAMLREVAG